MKFRHWLTGNHEWKENSSKFFSPVGGRARGFTWEELLKIHYGFTRIYYECPCGASKYEDVLGKENPNAQ